MQRLMPFLGGLGGSIAWNLAPDTHPYLLAALGIFIICSVTVLVVRLKQDRVAVGASSPAPPVEEMVVDMNRKRQ